MKPERELEIKTRIDQRFDQFSFDEARNVVSGELTFRLAHPGFSHGEREFAEAYFNEKRDELRREMSGAKLAPILTPADIDRISIECKSCSTRVSLSTSAVGPELKRPEIPLKCPFCGDELQGLDALVSDCHKALRLWEGLGIAFHIRKPALPKD